MNQIDFRHLLQDELVKRCQQNPNYSLRAFAKSLSVEPSALSQMLNKKRPITEKMQLRLGTALGMTPETIFNIAGDNAEQGKPIKFKQMDFDALSIISEWHYNAILELTHTKNFKSKSDWIAQRLGITTTEVNIAIEKLLRLGLLKRVNSRWVEASDNEFASHLTPTSTSEGAKRYQIQLLEQSRKAVLETDLKKRNHTSITLSFDHEDLPAAIESIKKFRRGFAKQFQPKKQGTEVYQLQISFYPLTK